jgi:hypothetical protein
MDLSGDHFGGLRDTIVLCSYVTCRVSHLVSNRVDTLQVRPFFFARIMHVTAMLVADLSSRVRGVSLLSVEHISPLCM